MNKICVVGLGYIGLPTAAMLANHGSEVLGVDINSNIVQALNRGEILIEEPGLQEFVQQAVIRGSLRASVMPETADAFIIAVPTPITEGNKADLTYVESAVYSILPYLSIGNIVIVESTISPRTIEDIVCPILKKTGMSLGDELYVAHCPERVLPGQILHELVYNNRIIGGINGASSEAALEIYQTFVKGEMYITDATTAEMAKLMENTFRDVNIALSNELVLISEQLRVNALEVIQLANKHPRVNIHQPGPGVGGHCLAVDPYFIVEKAQKQAKMIALARKINSSMPSFVASQINKICGGKPSKVAVLGITYKGNIDDYRESPALEVIEHLLDNGVDVSIYDPHVRECGYALEKNIANALMDAECAVLLADHDDIKSIPYDEYARMMKNPVILDTKNCLGHFDKIILHKLGDYSKTAAREPVLMQPAGPA